MHSYGLFIGVLIGVFIDVYVSHRLVLVLNIHLRLRDLRVC